jgi:CheY-like chemotaxis protein
MNMNMNTILVVDDEKDILYVISQIIERIGFNVIIANSFKEAIVVFENIKFDVLLSDLNLNGNFSNGGCELCSRIKNIDASIVSIAMSGFFTDYDKKRILNVGFSDFLMKPVKLKDLQESVQCAFDRRNRWLKINNT